MRILITGGTGFVGRLFMANWPDYHYLVLSRHPDRARQILADLPHVKVLGSLEHLNHLNDIDAVINLAGEPIVDKRWTDNQKHIIEQSRWSLTERLVELCTASSSPPKTFISGSAIGYYGNQGEQLIDESGDSRANDFSSRLCRGWEQRARAVEGHSRLVLLRTGVVLHPELGALKKMLPAFRLGLGGRISHGQQYFSWIHWRDMIGAMHHLLIHDHAHGPFNMTAPVAVTNAQFTRSLANAVHRPAWFTVPAFVLKLLMGEASEMLLVSQNIYPQALLDSGFEFEFQHLDNALVDLFKS